MKKDQLEPMPIEKPLVNLSLSPDGRLVITSDDTQALDLPEELLAELIPRKSYDVLHLEHAPAYWVMPNVQDFFKEATRFIFRGTRLRRPLPLGFLG